MVSDLIKKLEALLMECVGKCVTINYRLVDDSMSERVISGLLVKVTDDYIQLRDLNSFYYLIRKVAVIHEICVHDTMKYEEF